MAPRAKRNGNGSRSSTFKSRWKKNPIGTLKAEFNKLGKAKYPVALIGIGLASVPVADEIVSAGSKVSPTLGSLMSVFTNYGKNLGMRFRNG